MARAFDVELAALEALAKREPSETLEPLRKALGNKNNLLVAKAAKIVAAQEHAVLLPELIAAFERFMALPGKADPQCWAKNGLAQALSAFECQEEALFLAGMRYVQLEPVWGGQEDTAATLRGQCAMGLVQCRSLNNNEVLTRLLPLFADAVGRVRVNAARAVEQVGSDAAVLLLRLRAELGSDEAEVLGACYGGVLRLEGARAIGWAERFLAGGKDGPDAASVEAAFAIAETRSAEGFDALLRAWKSTRDREFRTTLLTAMAVTRQETATEFLLGLVADGSVEAREALESSGPSSEVLERLSKIG